MATDNYIKLYHFFSFVYYCGIRKLLQWQRERYARDMDIMKHCTLNKKNEVSDRKKYWLEVTMRREFHAVFGCSFDYQSSRTHSHSDIFVQFPLHLGHFDACCLSKSIQRNLFSILRIEMNHLQRWHQKKKKQFTCIHSEIQTYIEKLWYNFHNNFLKLKLYTRKF